MDWLGYASNYLVSPHGCGGRGLALYWKQGIKLEILKESNNFIDTKLKHEGRDMFITFVYGEPDQTKRREIWSNLNKIGISRDASWLLIGDFNEILDNSEKQGGITRSESSFVDFDPSSLK